jgi:acetyl esterase/lipase
MTPRTRLLTPIACAFVLVLAACGSDDSSSTATSAAVAPTTAGNTTTATETTATAAPVDTTDTTEAGTASGEATTATTGAGRPGGGPPGLGGGGTAPAATHAAVTYATLSAAQTLDIWLPEAATAPMPLVVYVHGGAFKVGDSAMAGSKVQPLLDAGFAVASVNYRLSGEALFPAAIQDVKAAIRYLRANAATYGYDPDRIAAWGESAGGNLVALLGTTSGQDTPLDDPALGNADVSSDVQAVVDWFGPTDFGLMDTQAAEAGNKCTSPEQHDPASSPESAYIGAEVQTALDVVAQANPITYVSTATSLPPFSIAHGDADCNVPYQQSEILAEALTAGGHTVELTILTGASHADARFDSELMAPTIDWLTSVLG